MKGKYSGRHMTIYGYVLPGTKKLANWVAGVRNTSKEAKRKLKVLDWLKAHQGNVSLTARHFGLNRGTVRVWRDNFNRGRILSLNPKSHRPKNVRHSTTSWQTIDEIVRLRKQYPSWSKYKIAVILKRDQKVVISASTIGRVLKKKGLIDHKISRRNSRSARNPKKRFPKGFKIHREGDMVQMDTKHVTLIGGGEKIYQFTAIDVLTKRRVLKYYSSLASKNGANFLEYCLSKFPFMIRNIQTDNGPEFQKDFEKLCQKLSIPHYFTHARSPKENTYVESSHRADEMEFYRQGNITCTIKSMQERLSQWEHTWNFIRPHESLDYLTPDEYFNKYKVEILPTKNVITLQT